MILNKETELEWSERYQRGELTHQEIEELEQYLRQDAEARKRFRQFARLDSYLTSQAQAYRELEAENIEKIDLREGRQAPKIHAFHWLSLAAVLALSVFALFMNEQEPDEMPETSIQGFAVIKHLVDEKWNGQKAVKVGDLVSNQMLDLKEGLVQLDFFCGASVVVQGPAKLEVTSAWSATCHEGKLRAVVPAAARGFKIHTAQGEIEDLGTEFSVAVSDQKAQVHVIDGKVILHSEQSESQEMNTGDRLKMTSAGYEETKEITEVAGLEEVRLSSLDQNTLAYERWAKQRSTLMKDHRLRAYFPMDRRDWDGKTILDRSAGETEVPQDATMLGFANKLPGRFEDQKFALDVRRLDARARVFVEGSFKAYTFFTWVRIDSLSQQYNALFMGDNYNNGEPHWQIREDGKLMMSVMVNEHHPKRRVHKIYYSPVFWDESLSGKWIQIASTYDPVAREVVNYFNGEVLSEHEIEDEFFVEDLKIGGAELGSWGLPFKPEDTRFALRNLNGLIDEMMIFDEALSREEIKTLYSMGRPD